MNKMINKFIIFLLLLFSGNLMADQDRLALIIGNSDYENLGILSNTKNDAVEIEKALKEIGFQTKIVLDASEANARKAIKNFASQTEGASVALFFYAGHGAQINGENYILPIDIEIPKRESDIQLSAIKVDDIINTIKAKTKVVFLDACRDNPALIKTLSKGRGGFRGGLAPTKSSSDDGSGIFIAYATDAGNVALDGTDQKNSPFTTALLKYIKRPVSIDDMFSMVTKDVRAATKNNQRPYKYASIDGVVCLTSNCGAPTISPEPSTMKPAATPQAESNEWLFVLTGVNPKTSIYIQPVSYGKFENRAWITAKFIKNDDEVEATNNTSNRLPYTISRWVVNCDTKVASVYQAENYSKDGLKLSDEMFGDPRFISLAKGTDYSQPGTVGYGLSQLVCNAEKLKPIISNINDYHWERTADISSTRKFYFSKKSIVKNKEFRDVLVKVDFKEPVTLSDSGISNMAPGYQGTPTILGFVALDRFDCKNKQFSLVNQNSIGLSNEVASLDAIETKELIFYAVILGSPLETLMLTVCQY